MDEGYIKLYRALLNDALWKICSPEQKVIMITILLKANHKSNKWGWNGNKFDVLPGEFITSLENLKNYCGKKISLQNIRSALAKFKKYGFLTEEVTKVNRKIIIRNWNKYQTTNKVTNKEVTKRSQRGNKEVTTNKNDKNDKNEKNEKKKIKHLDFVYLFEDEYKKLIEQIGEDKTKKTIEKLNCYIGSKGKKYKSHYFTILNWIKMEEDRKPNKKQKTFSGDYRV
jgi:DNA replication protein DnaD